MRNLAGARHASKSLKPEKDPSYFHIAQAPTGYHFTFGEGPVERKKPMTISRPQLCDVSIKAIRYVMPGVPRLLTGLFILAFLFPQNSKAQDHEFHQRLEGLYEREDLLIRPRVLRDSLRQDKDLYLLDSRTPEEFRVSHLPGVRRVDFEDFAPRRSIPFPGMEWWWFIAR
jgi:hypothetical protein